MMHLRALPTRLLTLCLLGLLKSCLGLPIGNEARQAELKPLLTAAQETPDLSKFYSLFASTGGKSEIPGPALGERFNNPDSSLQYTLLAPTNDGFASIAPAFLQALTSTPSYELLLTLLQNYVLPENLTFDELTSRSDIRTIGGFTFHADPDGSIQTNKDVTKTAVPIGKEANILLDGDKHPLTVPASNGIIYKIDKLFDPLITYFGEDGLNDTPVPVTKQKGTMADILRQHQNLTTLFPVLEQIDPEFVNRLSLYSQDSAVNARTVYLAPSNTAFQVLPDSDGESATHPSNEGSSSLLLEFGLGEYDEGAGYVRSASGFNITVGDGRANNAGIQEKICAENGCVWLVGRWLDPLFGAFM